jgi:hypothetical protein
MDKVSQDTSLADKAIKESISNQIARIEQQISLISGHASEASAGSIGKDMQEDEVKRLKDLVAWLRRASPYGDQSKNKTYYNLPEVLPSGDPARSKNDIKTASEVATETGTLSALTENSLLADATLSKVEATNTKVDLLVASGKKFDAARAKGDLLKVASSVETLLRDADLAQPWVKGELHKLAEEAKKLHALFAPAKV